MTTPEQIACQKIDELLTAAGWEVQDYKHINLGAGFGVVEAKQEGTTTRGDKYYG